LGQIFPQITPGPRQMAPPVYTHLEPTQKSSFAFAFFPLDGVFKESLLICGHCCPV